MLLVNEPEEDQEVVINYDSEYNFPSGITPPTKNIRKRKYRKTFETAAVITISLMLSLSKWNSLNTNCSKSQKEI